MTETLAAQTVAVRSNKRAVAGVLSNIQHVPVGEKPVVLASLTVASTGTIYTLMIQGEALERVSDVLNEGESVRFYGDVGPQYVTVIGFDLTKRTLARQAGKATAETTDEAPKAKRLVSDRQRENGKAFFARVNATAKANREARLAARQTA